jgi:hypothetical protein
MSCVFHIQRKVGWQLNTLRLGKLARTLKIKLCSHFYLRTSTGPCHATSVPAQLPLLVWNSFFHLAMASTLEMHHWSPLRQPRAWTYTSHHCSYIKGYWSLLYFLIFFNNILNLFSAIAGPIWLLMLLIQVASISGSLHWLFCHIMHLLAWPTCEGNTYDLQSSTINGIVWYSRYSWIGSDFNSLDSPELWVSGIRRSGHGHLQAGRLRISNGGGKTWKDYDMTPATWSPLSDLTGRSMAQQNKR